MVASYYINYRNNIAINGFVMINLKSLCYFANFTNVLLNLLPGMHKTNMLFLSTWILVYISKPTSLLNQVLLSLSLYSQIVLFPLLILLFFFVSVYYIHRFCEDCFSKNHFNILRFLRQAMFMLCGSKFHSIIFM